MVSLANSKMMCVPAEKRSKEHSSGGEEAKGLGKLIRYPELNGTLSIPPLEVLFSEEVSKRPLHSPLKYIFRLVRTTKFGTYASQNLTSLSQPKALLSRKEHNDHHKVIIMKPNELSIH
jgi:hypothetical protein